MTKREDGKNVGHHTRPVTSKVLPTLMFSRRKKAAKASSMKWLPRKDADSHVQRSFWSSSAFAALKRTTGTPTRRNTPRQIDKKIGCSTGALFILCYLTFTRPREKVRRRQKVCGFDTCSTSAPYPRNAMQHRLLPPALGMPRMDAGRGKKFPTAKKADKAPSLTSASSASTFGRFSSTCTLDASKASAWGDTNINA